MIDLYSTNGSSPPAHHRCGTTLGAACWAASLLVGQRVYHAPCAEAVGHCGACLCGRCGTVIAMRRTPVTTAPVIMRASDVIPFAVYVVALADVALMAPGALPLVALICALCLRFGLARGQS